MKSNIYNKSMPWRSLFDEYNKISHKDKSRQRRRFIKKDLSAEFEENFRECHYDHNNWWWLWTSFDEP